MVATNQIQATTPLTKTAKQAPKTPNVDLIRTGKLIPYTQPTYPFAIAGIHASTWPTRTAPMAAPRLKPFVIEDEAT